MLACGRVLDAAFEFGLAGLTEVEMMSAVLVELLRYSDDLRLLRLDVFKERVKARLIFLLTQKLSLALKSVAVDGLPLFNEAFVALGCDRVFGRLGASFLFSSL